MSNATAAPEKVFCDWRIDIYNCEMSELWVAQVTVSLVTYALLTISGTSIFCYRYKYMWKGLWVDHGHGIRPLPVDTLLFFWTSACFLRGLHSLLMLVNAYTKYWQKEFMQELGWTVLTYGGVNYLIGIIYTIPVNYTRGTSATIKLESKKDSLSYFTTREIYIPTPRMLNVILGVWLLWPTTTALPFSVLSGLAKDHGNHEAALRWTAAQYISYIFFNSAFAVIGSYYGIHFMLILRNSMKQFSRRSESSTSYYHSNSDATRGALDRLKYTMTYIAVLPMISAPWWGIYGIFHDTITDSINGVNLFLSFMWHVGGAQPLIAVANYTLAKRVYQHYTGHSPSDELTSSTTSSSDLRKSTMSPTSPTFPVTLSSAVLKHNQQDLRENDGNTNLFQDIEKAFNNKTEDAPLSNNGRKNSGGEGSV